MGWTRSERSVFSRLRSPSAIQGCLDEFAYNTDTYTRSVRGVISSKKAHCLDGALFAAAALESLGFPPLLMDLRASENDDDHVLAPFCRDGLWGAVAKSNFSGLRYREPVYRSLRELAMSYFESYFNLRGERTLREYSRPLNLGLVSFVDWRFGSLPTDALGPVLDSVRHFDLLPQKAIRRLTPVDSRTLAAGKVGLVLKGAFK